MILLKSGKLSVARTMARVVSYLSAIFFFLVRFDIQGDVFVVPECGGALLIGGSEWYLVGFVLFFVFFLAYSPRGLVS